MSCWIKLPHPLLIFSQSDYLIQIADINSHTEWQTVQIHISWLLQKPNDVDLHCLQMQGISRLSKIRVNKEQYWDCYILLTFQVLLTRTTIVWTKKSCLLGLEVRPVNCTYNILMKTFMHLLFAGKIKSFLPFNAVAICWYFCYTIWDQWFEFEPAHDKIYDKTCTTSKDSDEPAHPCSLISLCWLHVPSAASGLS